MFRYPVLHVAQQPTRVDESWGKLLEGVVVLIGLIVVWVCLLGSVPLPLCCGRLCACCHGMPRGLKRRVWLACVGERGP